MNLAQTLVDDLKKMFLIHYVRQGNRGIISEQEKKDVVTVLNLNEFAVKEAVLRRVLFLFLISSVANYFIGKAHNTSPTASILTASICTVALVFLYLDVFVPLVLLAAWLSLLAICWMDYQAFLASALFSALYALYFFARLRAN
ncbi:hypothetical protein [Mesorhizobium sp. WSM3860]|uniref:hypothetical protein n=1 Tax=Mesorhizobium sp. WSM3860 TaxID=2029403 RepID=UPI000BAE91B0|nr:hypothetical protein [Mesorhizobium sp. WSM3860]PBC05876.1 hypothetical protein CK220_01445 [Mesorhizobium sp. WSM3860]